MSSSKNWEIEFLCGVAILMTLVTHVNQMLPFHAEFLAKVFNVFSPWSGVDLFFCISGFVVSKSYLDYFDKHRTQGNFGIAAVSFWIRRAYRLLPTAWLWVLIPLVFSIVFNQSNAFDSWYNNLRSFTAVATFSGNLANMYGVILGPNSVYWSLALEEQFYFIFPLFLLLVTSPKWRVITLLLLIAAQFGFDRNAFAPPPAGLLFSFRLDAMMWGVLLCIFTRSDLYKQVEPTALKNSLLPRALVTLFLLYMLGAIAGQLIMIPIAVGLIAIVSALIVWLASYQQGYIFCPSFLTGPLKWLGSRSYALYVIHMFAYHLSTEIWSRVAAGNDSHLSSSYTIELLLTSVSIMLVMSELNYRYVEQPLRKRGAEIAKRKLSQLGEYETMPASLPVVLTNTSETAK
ncbi:acyltransferase family protein [Pseudomonas koreensis]|jgi:peptidoglycan/LPS O-acetylase OafA/YrhL|uniref:acyltransferase family protein n=1 Tax=Pseudomonas koreensis TaxID=198620 RepID=UPI001B32ACB6|nr:acyltransferase [Pseudomonas koreensis]MBP3998305.1 acyltransferase [Pseudomonas koreensis]